MSENSSNKTSSANLKGIKHLLWIGVISVWAAMSLILYTASVNYQNYQEVRSMLNAQGKAAGLVSELSTSVAEINASVEKLSGKQEATSKEIGEQVVQKIAGEIRTELSPNIAKMNANIAKVNADIAKMNAGIAKMNDSVKKLFGEQKTMTDKIGTGLVSNAESVGKLLVGQKTAITRAVSGNKAVLDKSFQKLSGGQNAILEAIRSDNRYNSEAVLDKSFQKLSGGQNAILEAIRSDNHYNSEKIRLLKELVQHQATLLNQLSGILSEPETAQK